MLNFEVLNELTLKVTCTGNDVLFAKAGAFIGGESQGGRNYSFEKMLLGPQNNLGEALLGSLVRRVTGENIPLMKVTMSGNSITYYANYGRHIVVYKLAPGEIVSVESENLLAFTPDCDYSTRFIGTGVISQKGLFTSTLTGKGKNAFVALISDGNPLVLSNITNSSTITVDPDAVICWFSRNGYGDPQIRTDISWKNFIGQHSGESYMFEWTGGCPVSVLVQPSERAGGIRVGID
ncbi:MAG: AIM24 family protein [Ruminococcus sp.]|nr:AIM24 family protein [Ruminococcus sp.]